MHVRFAVIRPAGVRGAVAGIAAALAACSVAGCTGQSGADPSATSTRPTAHSTAHTEQTPDPSSGGTGATAQGLPADVPTTGPNLLTPDERPPVMPLAATEHTTEGAVAFAKFFVQTIDWGFATTSGAYMRHYFSDTCVECSNHAEGIDNTANDGFHYIGGRFSVTDVTLISDAPDPQVVVEFDIANVTVVDESGTQGNSDHPRPNIRRQLTLNWSPPGWTVVDMRPA